MKTRVLFLAFVLFVFTFSMAQHGNNNAWKHQKKMYKKDMKWQKKQDKKRAKYYKEMRKNEREYHREMAKMDREYYREMRKSRIDHLDHCRECDHGFYHNDDYYYQDDVYYSRRTRSPIRLDAELFLRNGAIRVSL